METERQWITRMGAVTAAGAMVPIYHGTMKCLERQQTFAVHPQLLDSQGEVQLLSLPGFASK